MPKDYDIQSALREIENELLESMFRNLNRHKAWEEKEDMNWEQWQVLQLKALEEYKTRNSKVFNRRFDIINAKIKEVIEEARKDGNLEQELEILKQIQEHKFKSTKMPGASYAAFLELSDRKLEALIKATTDDLEKAEHAMLRMANDQYRKIIFNAQVYANTGAATYEKAVDMASRDFLKAGINCVEYKNGARHTIQDYADMAIRTASKRAQLTGEGEKRKEWGITTVIVNKRGNPCPKCLPFVGKVLIDDVWSGGTKRDGNYALMSEAIEAGLYHPRCKDGHTTYFAGITKVQDKYTKDEIEEISEDYNLIEKLALSKRNYERYERLENFSLDGENKRKYSEKKEVWYKEYKSHYKEYAKGNRKISNLRRSISAANELGGKVLPINALATFKINIPGYTDKLNDVISKSCKDVVYEAGESGKEILHLIDLDAGKIAYTEKGGTGYVGGEKYKEFLRLNPGRYAFVHNHPDGDGLSTQDVATLLTKNIEVMIGSGNNGSVYVGIVHGERNIDLYKEYVRIEKEVKSELQSLYEAFKQGELIYPEYSRISERETCKRLILEYGELYEVNT